MNGAFYIGAIGIDAQQRALDVIANNIANLNTAGFKRSAVQFSELVAPARDAADLPVSSPDRAMSLAGVAINSTQRVWSQGDLKQTGSPLDVAVNGSGLFEVLGPSGKQLLWRGGTLKVNQDGYLATSDGLALRALISVPHTATALTIAPDGMVSAITDDKGTRERLGQLELMMPKDLSQLADAGDGMYELSDETSAIAAQPGEDGSGTIVQGAIEGGNVQLTDEMTSLLLVQRAYAANAQVLQAADQLLSIANGLRR